MTYLGITTLHMAVESGNFDLVKFVVEQGGDVKAVDVVCIFSFSFSTLVVLKKKENYVVWF